MGIKGHHTGNKVESLSLTCSLHFIVQLWHLDIEGIWQKEALGVWNVSPQKNTGCAQGRQAEKWRHQVVPWTVQECGRRSTTPPLWSCLQDGSSSVPMHYSVWENPWLQTRWQTEEEMLDDVRTDCTELGLSMYQAVRSAQDRALWRRMLEELPRRTVVSQRP